MKYPLEERIGRPELLVGRKKEFEKLNQWLENIPMKLSQSIAILSRKKSGKTAIVQRVFNQLWSAGDEMLQDPNAIPIIPFYLEIPDRKIWYPDFAIDYYREFATQYISYLERDETMIRRPLQLEQIKAYGEKSGITALADDVDSLLKNRETKAFDLMWKTAYTAPHQFASLYDQRIVVMIDEFQNMNRYIYRDELCEHNYDETLVGSYHEYSESKVAPMMVTGSYVGWLVQLVSQYLEGGRLRFWELSPYLSKEEGLEAVYQYAKLYREPITNLSASLINELCMADPFFIGSVIKSTYPDRELTTKEGVMATVNYELSNRKAEMARTWGEYINRSLDRINDRNGKNILLHLSKHADRPWTHLELKETLNLDMEPKQILQKLRDLVDADLIEEGISDISFQGLRDGTLCLILRNRFEEEINSFPVDLKKEFSEKHDQMVKEIRSLRGKLNYVTGKIAEEMFATELRSKKRIRAIEYFTFPKQASEQISGTPLNLTDVRTRQLIQRPDGKNLELDVVAQSDSDQTLLIEVKKTKEKIGPNVVTDFKEKVKVYQEIFQGRTVIPAFFSAGGFTDDAKKICDDEEIGTMTELTFFLEDLKNA